MEYLNFDEGACPLFYFLYGGNDVSYYMDIREQTGIAGISNVENQA